MALSTTTAMVTSQITLVVLVLVFGTALANSPSDPNSSGSATNGRQNPSVYAYAVAGDGAPKDERLTVINLDLLSDEEIASDVETGLEEEFEFVDRMLGEDTDDTPLPEHRKDRQMSLIYRGVYTPDSRFNAFVDGVLVNMVTEIRRRRMDPLYFRVHKRGIVEHVPTGRRTGKMKSKKKKSSRSTTTEAPKREAIGGGVIRGLAKIKRFGSAEIQVAGNTTLVRSHVIFGPVEVEITFETGRGVRVLTSQLSALAGHGLARVTSDTAEFLDFLIDSPSEYEINLEGSKNKRFLRLSKSAILRLTKREGRLERRLMRMFAKAGTKPLPTAADSQPNHHRLWPTKGGAKKTEEPQSVTETVTEKQSKAGAKKPTYEKKPLKKTEKIHK